jgi:hypothetical protein
MDNERVIGRTPLCLKDFVYGRSAHGVRSQTVDSLGWECNQFVGTKQLGSGFKLENRKMASHH